MKFSATENVGQNGLASLYSSTSGLMLQSADINATPSFVPAPSFDRGFGDHQYGLGKGHWDMVRLDYGIVGPTRQNKLELDSVVYSIPLESGLSYGASSAAMNPSFSLAPPTFDMGYMAESMNAPQPDFHFTEQTMVPAIQPTFIPSFYPTLAAAPMVAPTFPLAITPNGRSSQCSFPGCFKSFKRVSCRKRHEDTVHLGIPGTNLCPIRGCIKSQGGGWKRADKVTQHLWEKHANLGYTKA
ncbi:hypothetical protein VTL71DRAFT_133 [Oculimacula yallundae]|uniref:C2H2-type domain-containing protein n=1 Tax=Oculimacula yallundae TaxID=86028 RepID=A0ABR4CZB0_9HELO